MIPRMGGRAGLSLQKKGRGLGADNNRMTQILSPMHRISATSGRGLLAHDVKDRPMSFWSHGSDKDRAAQREQDLDAQDLLVQKGKLLIKHLLDKYDKLHHSEASDEAKPSPSADSEDFEDCRQYQEILFNLLVPKQEFSQIDSISDFVDLI